MFDLRDYQHNLCGLTVEHMNEGGAPCLVSPTGSGKTVMLAEITRLYRQWGYQVILAAHRNEIIKQIAASCRKHCDEPVGFYTASRMTEDRGIMVTMMPTLARRREAVSTFRGRVLLLDEAHHIQAKTYQEIIREMQPSFFAGASATPVTPTGAGLGKFGITKLILGPQPKKLMDEGSLCKYKMFGGDDAVVDTKGVTMQGGDYRKQEIEERIVNVQGDFLRDLLHFNPDLKPTITVTISIEHAHMIAAEYKSRGISAQVVIGSTSQRDRDLAFERFTAGDLKVIVSVALIDEGLDLPAATCLQLIRPTRSLRLWKQLIGRVLRTDPENPDKTALIIDHGNCWQQLPLPHEPIDWTLEGKVKFKKTKLQLDENKEIVEKPDKPETVLVARGDRQKMKELSIEDLYQQRIEKRVKAAKKNLFLVEAKGFNPAILWPWANSPEGLDNGQRRRVERALGLPYGHCGEVASGQPY
jgi:superfamily II DNA or RNA helicase